jgi:hypothetical protein
MGKSQMTWLDVRLGRFKWYRKRKGGDWWKHQFTKDAEQINIFISKTYWARYPKLNRYTEVIEHEYYERNKKGR